MMYTKNELALIFLSSFSFYSKKKVDLIEEKLGELENIFSLSNIQKIDLKEIVGNENFVEFCEGFKTFDCDKVIENFEKRGIKVLTKYNSNFPIKLSRVVHSPYILFYVGDISLIDTACLAVVGTRSPSFYGRQITEKIISEVASNGVTIISGLATGIDKIAHETALFVNGKTIAVLGGGFDNVFPAMNINLAREIAKKGLLITEYYPTIKATKYTFPTRNRIIAGLSEGVLIPEAGYKSGTIYTKDYALEMGIDIYAIPGSIISEKSQLPNSLIKSGQCFVVTSSDDILSNFGIKKQKNKKRTIQLSAEEQIIVNCLKDGEKSVDELIILTNLSSKSLTSCLTTLEISGLIRKSMSNRYVIN